MVKFDELFGEPAEGFKPDKKKRVGGYILGKTLGEGSFAKVRIATHVLTNEKVSCILSSWLLVSGTVLALLCLACVVFEKKKNVGFFQLCGYIW